MVERDLFLELSASSKACGFEVCSGVDWNVATQEAYHQYSLRFEDWIAKDLAGEMNYLVRGQDRRRNPELVFPDLKSIFVVLSPYARKAIGQRALEGEVQYARYLKGADYHDRLKDRLNEVFQDVKNAGNPGLKWKVCVDTSAVLERTWACLAGLGWIGKNAMLIHPQLGSYTFIGVVFLNESLNKEISILSDYCGQCTRCLQSCPTQAILDDRLVDSKQCISYLTLEKRGPLSGEETKAVAAGGFIAGCDICQEVCPFNSKASRLEDPNNLGVDSVSNWVQIQKLEQESNEQYEVRVQFSALNRVRRENFLRNLEALQSAKRSP